MVCPECGSSRVIYAPDDNIVDQTRGEEEFYFFRPNESSGSGDIVCSNCGLVLGRWQISLHGQLEETFYE